jgi:hypothetical protein
MILNNHTAIKVRREPDIELTEEEYNDFYNLWKQRVVTDTYPMSFATFVRRELKEQARQRH